MPSPASRSEFLDEILPAIWGSVSTSLQACLETGRVIYMECMVSALPCDELMACTFLFELLLLPFALPVVFL